MSFSLPDVDLTTAVVGTSGKILLQNMGISAGGISANPATYKNPAMLNIRNDSGCGLGMVLRDTGGQFTLGAGEWTQQSIPPGESAIIYTVKYLLPNPPVSLLMIDYYAPGETVPQTSTLGNSPVGIGGSVQTSSVQTLSNEGNVAGGLVEDIGDVAFSQLFTLYTDGHGVWAVDQSGVKHQVLKIQTSGNPLQLGQSGDPVEVLGSLTVDGVGAGITDLGPLAVSGASTLTGATSVGGLLTASANIAVTSAAIATQNGSITGTATFYMPERGTVKKVVVIYSNFKQGAATLAKVVLPVGFTSMAQFVAGDMNGTQVFLGAGSVINVNKFSAAATFASSADITNFTFGEIPAAFDTLQIESNSSITHNGVLTIIGV